MKGICTLAVISIVVIAGLVGVAVLQAIAAEPAREGPKKAVTVRIDPRRIRVAQARPLPFRPFALAEVRDPQTNKPITADSLVVLRRGSRTRGSDYLEELNRIEKGLTQLGYTLRTPQKQRIRIAELVTSPDVLARQRARMDSFRVVNKSFKSRLIAGTATQKALESAKVTLETQKKMEALGKKFEEQTAAREAQAYENALKALEKVAFTTGKSLGDDGEGYVFGEKETFQAYVKGGLSVKVTALELDVSANGHVGGYILDHYVPVLDATARVTASRSKPETVGVTVKVVGMTVYELDESAEAAWRRSSTESVWQQKDLVHISTTIPVGPVPLNLEVGAGGKFGCTYALSAGYLFADAKVTPFGNVSVYASASVGMEGVAEADVAGTLTLVDAEANFDARLALEGDSSKDLCLVEEYSGSIRIGFLKGSISAGVEVLGQSFESTFWTSPGYETEATLWRVRKEHK